LEAIKDELRIGTPVTFSAEQVTQIIALACSEPLASGRPISHWVPGNCGRSNQTRDCRNNFDPLGRAFFKKEADLKPHQSRYWLNANPSDPKLLQSKWRQCVSCMLKQLSYTNKEYI